jgi:hypothetical protein
MVEQLASREPPPDYSPKPKSSKLRMKPAKRRRPSTRSLAAAARERRPSDHQLPKTNSGAAVWLLAVGALGLAVAILLFVLTRSGPPSPRVVDGPPDVRVDPEPESGGGDSREKGLGKLARAKSEYDAALLFSKKNPGRYAEAIKRLQKARTSAAGTEWAKKADDALESVRARRKKAADRELEELTARSAQLAGAGNYDAALSVVKNCPPNLRPEMEGPLTKLRAGLEREATGKIKAAIAAAETLSKEGRPRQGLAALAKVRDIKFEPLAGRLEALRTRLEKEKLDVAELERKRAVNAARDLHARLLEEFDEHLLAGRYSQAAKGLRAGRAKIDEKTRKHVPAGLEESLRLAGGILELRERRRNALAKLVGHEVEVRRASGGTIKGTVQKVTDGALEIRTKFKGGGTMDQTVRFSELAPGELARLAPAVKPRGANADLIAAILAVAGRDFPAARKALEAAKGHVLHDRWSRRLAKLDAAHRDSLARQAWKEKVATLVREKYSGEQGKALLAALDAFVAAHRATEFARGKAAEIETLRLETGSLAARVPRLFRGKLVRFDPRTLDIELLYDFSGADQISDFAPHGTAKVSGGRMLLEDGGGANCRARFESDLRVSWTWNRLSRSDLGVRFRSGERAVAVRMKESTTGLWLSSKRVEGAANFANGHARLIDGKFTVYSHDRRVFQPRDLPRGLLFFGLRANMGKGAFDNLSVSGRLNRAWLERALLEITPPKLAAGRKGTGLLGEYFEGRHFEKLLRSQVDPVISFAWDKAPAKGVPADQFCTRWTGFLHPPGRGKYTFSVFVNDWARLWIDGRLLATNWGGKHSVTCSGTADLEAGRLYPIRLEFYDNRSNAEVRLRWKGPGIEGTQTVATEHLYPLEVKPETLKDPTPKAVRDPRVAKPSADPRPFLDQKGLVVMEAEHYTGIVPGQGKAKGITWRPVLTREDSSGKAAMLAVSDAAKNLRGSLEGPRLDYAVQFSAKQTYCIWVRMQGGGSSDSIHVGLDGKPLSLGGKELNADGSRKWTWVGKGKDKAHRVKLKVGPGRHVLNIWMRETGVAVDKIVLTAQPHRSFAKQCPPESPRAGDR